MRKGEGEVRLLGVVDGHDECSGRWEAGLKGRTPG